MLLDYLTRGLCAGAQRAVSVNRQRFSALAAGLDAMSPLKVLGRGYAIATDRGGNLVRSVNNVKNGDKLRLCVSDGIIKCRVEESEARADE